MTTPSPRVSFERWRPARRRFRTLEGARAASGHFLAFIYNGKRRRSPLGYRTPEEFEVAFAAEMTALRTRGFSAERSTGRFSTTILHNAFSDNPHNPFPTVQMRGRTARWIF